MLGLLLGTDYLSAAGAELSFGKHSFALEAFEDGDRVPLLVALLGLDSSGIEVNMVGGEEEGKWTIDRKAAPVPEEKVEESERDSRPRKTVDEIGRESEVERRRLTVMQVVLHQYL